MNRILLPTKEGLSTAGSQIVSTLLIISVVAATFIAIVLTTGRSVGAEQRILQRIDSVGSRSIIIKVGEGAGVDSSAIARLSTLANVAWYGGLSSAVDSVNAAVPDGARVALRYVHSPMLAKLGLTVSTHVEQTLAYPTARALSVFGMSDLSGRVSDLKDGVYGIGGEARLPDYLQSIEPVVLIPSSEPAAELGLVVIVADRPDHVTATAKAAVSMLAAEDPSKVQVTTPAVIAELRGAIEGEIQSLSRGLLVGLLGAGGFLVSIIVFTFVVMRRKDYGRRRALGATREFIILMVVTQTAALALLGSLVGGVVAFLVLLSAGDPQPGLLFNVGLAGLTAITASAAAFSPAVVASRREPIRELRVP